MKRAIIIALIVLVLLALAGPFLPLGFLRPGIAGALARALGRQVEIDGVSLTFFPAPALALSGVTIHEDPRAGIEPFAYAENVDAQVNLRGLLGGRRKFSQLRLTGATLNLVKTDAVASSSDSAEGQWNVQYLVGSAGAADAPSIQMRAGRVNIKLGHTKSVLFFDDADVDIAVSDKGAVDLRFSGEPERTDRPAETFGHIFVSGTLAPANGAPQTNLRAEMEPSTLDGIARMLGATGLNLQGQVALNAQISGPAANLEIKGDLEFQDDRRTSVLPQFGGKAKLGFEGVFDLDHQTLRIASAAFADQPFSIKAETSNFLASPQWTVTLDLQEAPLAALYGAARQIGVPIPEKLSVAGTVTGTVEASSSAPVSGELTLSGPSVTPAGASPIKAETATVSISGGAIALKPTIVAVGEEQAEKQTATLEATYKMGDGSEGDARITTRGLTIAAARGWNLSDVPLVGRIPEGTWRGVARLHHARSGENRWSGEYQLVNARVSVDGLTEPVRIVTATVAATAERTVVSRIRASAGKIPFTAEYRWEPKAKRPHQFQIRIDQADGPEIERLFKPTLDRAGGFLQRTLSLGSPPPPPDWLIGRHAVGTVSIGALNVAGHSVALDTALVVWDGTDVTLDGSNGRIDEDAEDLISGTLRVNLAGRLPKYHFDGRYHAAGYRGGRLDMKGTLDSSGTGADLLTSVRTQGTFSGRAIGFSPEADFRSIAGRFDARVAGGTVRWTFTDIDAAIGGESYTGEGGSQADGKVVLDLVNRGRQVRYTGSLVAAAPNP